MTFISYKFFFIFSCSKKSLRIAYTSQEAWIQNCTLRDNILFGKHYDQANYDRIVRACSLEADFAVLPGGDQTEIGEKGINLSGGDHSCRLSCQIVFVSTR